ncbi:hypothetical protein GGI11_003606, partial [Coemansia sp. RSA 2049]
MPSFGLGTWQQRDSSTVKRVVHQALDAGYRLIDTASAYRNETAIGSALAETFADSASGLCRKDVWITSKLSPKQQGFEGATAAVLQSLRNLQTDYIDLYLIHWPGISGKPPVSTEHRLHRKESWRALEKLYNQGKVRAIGVSNYTSTHLKEMEEYAEVMPMVNHGACSGVDEKETTEIQEYAPADSAYAWVIVACAAFNLMCTLGVANSFGVFSTYYLNYIYPDISASNVAWVGTTISLFMLGGAVVTGPLTDRFGFRMIALSGTATCSLGLLLASFTSALWELVLTQGVMFGLGAACIFSPSVSLPAQWHVKRRPLATGIAVAGSGAGGMIFTQITQTMIEAIGHKWTLRVLALILLFVSGASGMFYKRRLPVPVGGTSLVSLAKDSRLIAVGCAGFFVNISYFVPWYYLPTAALQLGQTKQAANNLVLYMNAGSTVGRVLAAYVAIALGPIN